LKSTGERAVSRLVVATGISSVVTQLLIIRECLAQFQGNEFVIALILFNWLILGGVGTLMARVITRDFWPATIGRLGWLSFILAALPTLQIFSIRLFRDLFFVHGASVGFYPTLAYTFLAMAPYSFFVGFVLPFSLYALRAGDPSYAGTRIYILDNIGDVSGGALFAFVLVYLVTPLQGILLANLPLAICALYAFPRPFRRHPGPIAGMVLALSVLVSGVILEMASLAPREGELAHYRESRYGRVTVHQDREQYTVFQDGVPVFSSQNLVTAEESVHYPLAQVEKPNTVLLISAQSGMMAELEKYRLKRIDYVELNPEVTRVQFRFGLIRRIPGLKVIHRDGRAFLAASDTRYDAILINLPEPETFQTNRFFTDGFFSLARERLTPGGILSFSVQGYDNYLAEPQRQKISSLYNTAKDYFGHVRMLPGQKIYFLCGTRPLSNEIPHRLRQKKIATRYISRYFDGNLTGERIRQINELVDRNTPRNIDQSPRLMRIIFTQWFAKFSTSPRVFVIVVSVLCLVYLIRVTREEFVLFSTGFMTMGSEILVIFAFQIFFGYIYMQIGLIVTVFLAGLMPGAWIGYRLKHTGKRGLRLLVLTDLMLMVMLCIYILAVKKTGDPMPAAFFLLFGFAVSVICGCQFPIALNLKGDDNAAAARVFSADLMGAAFGTMFTSVALLPFVGIIGTAAGLIALKMLSLIVLGTGHEKYKQA